MTQALSASMDILQEGATQPARVPLQSDRLIIGRHAEAGVRLDGGTVSRQHAELFKDPFGRWWVRDLGSRNGTRVNGVKIQEHLLEPTDILQIENFTLRPVGIGPTRRPRRLGDSTGPVTMGDESPGRITTMDDMGAAPHISAEHVRELSAFAEELLILEEEDTRLERLCQLMVGQHLRGHCAVVLRIPRAPQSDPQEDEPHVLCGPHTQRNWRRDELPYVSRTLLRAARQDNAPAVASSVPHGTGVVTMSLAGNTAPVAAIVCPLAGDDPASLDLLYVTFPAEYATGQWLALCALAAEHHRHAQRAWDARHRAQEQLLIESELRRAHDIQQRLIPQRIDIPGLEVAMAFTPCRWVGGDYIDAITLPDGRALFIVADVCGKGLQAALVTASLHTLIHTNAAASLDLADLMNRMNRYLCRMLPDCSFVTAAAMLLDPAAGRFVYANAGHPPPLIADTQGRCNPLEVGVNPPLGFLPEEITVSTETLEAGQTLMLYTDGLSELPHHETGSLLGVAGVARMLAESRQARPASLAATMGLLNDELASYQGAMHPQDDKACILISRR